MTEQECAKKQEQCFKKNIKPVLDEMNKKLDAVLPTIKEINDLKKAWQITGFIGSCVVKIVIGVGIIIGGCYAMKDWIKK
jgi:hypothetical protein